MESSSNVRSDHPAGMRIVENVGDVENNMQESQEPALGSRFAKEQVRHSKKELLEESSRNQYFKKDPDELKSLIQENHQNIPGNTCKGPSYSSGKNSKQPPKKEEVVTTANAVVSLDKTGVEMTHLERNGTTGKRQSVLLKRGDTDLSLDQSGLQRLLPSFMQFAFADKDAEKIYREYYKNEKRADFKVLVQILIVTNVTLLLILVSLLACNLPPQPTSDLSPARLWSFTDAIPSLVGLVFSLAALIGVAALCSWSSSGQRIWSTLPLVMSCLEASHVVCDLWIYPVSRSASDTVSWVLLYTYSIYVIFPLRFRYCLTLALLLDCLHFSLILSSQHKQESFYEQLASNFVLFLSANILGMMSFFFYERQQRRAFLETCQSLEAKLVLEEESQKQERLLLSVLPKHVAAEIRQDLGAVVTGQFKKIYMSRHENVSILFADIVGFTAISSTCPAAELVRTLNELFARFDKLAEKYHQLRIKILGDCYYCISGAPEERSDHAVLCVHMGLSMVDAIKSVREQTKSPVDMRVGIHTGGVLAGVMGQKQWQFDVYSKDVELANKMESGGLPGMVHISEKTLSFLNGEFDVKDGDGAAREEAIRLAGIRTYLIVKVLKEWPEGTLDALQPVSPRTSLPEPDAFDVDESEGIIGPGGEIINVDEYNRRLLHELLNREVVEKNIQRHTHPCSLTFTEEPYEHEWRYTRDVTSCVSLMGLPITLGACTMAYIFIGPSLQLVPFLILLLSNSVLLVMAIIACAPSICSSIPKPVVSVSQAVQEKAWIRLVMAASMIAVWISAHVVANVFCYEDSDIVGLDGRVGVGGNVSSRFVASLEGNSLSTMRSSYSPEVIPVEASCPFPPFLVHFATLGMIAFTVLTKISYIIKTIVVVSLATIQVCLNLIHLNKSFEWFDMQIYGLELTLGHAITLSIVLITISVVLCVVNRQFELMSRRLFLWKKEVEEQKEKVGDMRQRNEALVYNILPIHVAVHFLGKRKKDEELYSKSYDAVGVLFAAMPNFSDFYTEESVNNQGLECLRFLNEVISDYDALLEQPRFKDIIKIKTIGSTYMAASGLNDCELGKIPPDASNTVKWAHLAELTKFALALKETLSNINKESFNNFVLRIGINHGPITAGVIGARKPHYDVWGNTVNVASRMESTGKAGSIQVVQETKEILEEFGFTFEQRGMVSVKGKGMLRTFYLIS